MHSRRDILTGLPIGLFGLAAGIGLRARPADADTGMVTVAYPSDVPNWDPISAGSAVTVSIYKCVFDLPLNLAPDLSFGPSVVATHRWLDAEAKVLELTLRDDVTFHNGDKLTSDDVKFTFFDRPHADNTLVIAGDWGASIVANVETPSPTKAIFTFNAPYVSAPRQLTSSTCCIMPRHYFEQVGRDAFMQKPIGSGPYRLVDYQRDSRIVLEAYDKYWAGPAAIKRLTFQVVKDVSARIAAIQSGQVDFAHNIPVREVLRLGAEPDLVGSLDVISSIVLIHMVNKGIYKDQNLRLAMHHAIDKPALSKAFYAGHAIPLSMWATEGMPANDPSFKFAYDPALAKTLLAKSGYSVEKPVKIQIYGFNGVFPNDYDLARAVVQMWKQVGIDAELTVIDITNYFDLARNDKLEAPVIYNWSNATDDPEGWSGIILNPKKRFSVWKSDDISPRLDPLLHEIDEDKRLKGYREFDRWAVEQGYAVPLLKGTSTVVHTKRIAYTPFRNGWVLPYYWKAS